MMPKYMVTVEINGLFDHEVKAESLEDALIKAKEIHPSHVITLKSAKKSGILDWEIRKVTSVHEA